MFNPGNFVAAPTKTLSDRLNYAIDNLKSHNNWDSELEMKFFQFGPTALMRLKRNGAEVTGAVSIQEVAGSGAYFDLAVYDYDTPSEIKKHLEANDHYLANNARYFRVSFYEGGDDVGSCTRCVSAVLDFIRSNAKEIGSWNPTEYRF